MKKIWTKIKEYFNHKRIEFKRLKKKIENKNTTIQNQAEDIHNLLDELNTYRSKTVELKRTERDLKQQIKELTRSDKKLKEIETLFEGKSVKIRDITKILEGDE